VVERTVSDEYLRKLGDDCGFVHVAPNCSKLFDKLVELLEELWKALCSGSFPFECIDFLVDLRASGARTLQEGFNEVNPHEVARASIAVLIGVRSCGASQTHGEDVVDFSVCDYLLLRHLLVQGAVLVVSFELVGDASAPEVSHHTFCKVHEFCLGSFENRFADSVVFVLVGFGVLGGEALEFASAFGVVDGSCNGSISVSRWFPRGEIGS
jgi:hypothetical protein